MTATIERTFSSLRVPNYRKYFTGQVISITGNWMQIVGEMWLMVKLTGSGVSVGLTAGLQFLPILLFGAWGGLLADRMSKRTLLTITQLSMMVPALTLFAHQLGARPVDEWVTDVVSALGDDVYISIDADGFDPSIVPAVGTAEPNGLLWNEAIELLAAVCAQRNVVGFDVVEIAPDPNSTRSEYTLAKLVYRLIGLVTLRER